MLNNSAEKIGFCGIFHKLKFTENYAKKTEKLSKADAESFYRQNIIYLMMLLASIFSIQFVIPNYINFENQIITFFGLDLLLALIFSGLAIIAGSLQVSKVNV